MDQRLGTRDTVGNLIDIESKKISLQATEKHHFTKNDAKIRVIYMLYFMLKFNFIFSKKKTDFENANLWRKSNVLKLSFFWWTFSVHSVRIKRDEKAKITFYFTLVLRRFGYVTRFSSTFIWYATALFSAYFEGYCFTCNLTFIIYQNLVLRKFSISPKSCLFFS